MSEVGGLIDLPVAHDQRVERLIAAFREQFRRPPEGISETPGRVNLIGEHVDYNDGLVLPVAIDRSVLCAWGRTWLDHEDLITWWSVDRPEPPALTNTHNFEPLNGLKRGGGWIDYPDAVVWALRSTGHQPGALFAAIAGDVPQGAGLSSSAALEVSVAGAFRAAFGMKVDDVALAKLCQRAENEYVGVQCGIMDQFASTLARRDHALLIDCRSLEYRHVPMRLAEAGLTIVIANSGVKRELVSSAYNGRRRECEEVVALLREQLGRDVRSLRDVTLDEVESAALPEVLRRRARHVVTEIGRVGAAVDALERSDFGVLGALMEESHLSLRNDHDVSSAELDLLVGLATAQEYVVGARMTGAGFGGCTVNVVRADALEAFARDVIAEYRVRTGLPAVAYVTGAEDGLRTWRVEG
jgi:galactokinase